MLALCGSTAAAAPATPPSPLDVYQELFVRVESQSLFSDDKTFADAEPRQNPAAILAAYRAHVPRDRAELAAFVAAHFDLPHDGAVQPAEPSASCALKEHIARLWTALQRPPTVPAPGSSALAFAFPHVIPGGRFRELYYWDSYFTALGLVRDGHTDIVQDMVAGFAALIARYGHIPNGTRTYYLSRSQPPVFFLMVGLLDPTDPAQAYAAWLPALRAEHAYWMSGERSLAVGTAAAHVVRLADGALLNRYWDARDTPRDEAYRKDVAVAQRTQRPAAEVYRDIRAAAESGWDFSSRWFADGRHLQTIETTAIVPVDLNSLLYGLEQAIALGCARVHDSGCETEFTQRMAARRAAIERYLWNVKAHCYFDYQWRRGEPTRRLSAATLYPLFVGAAVPQHAAAVAEVVERRLVKSGGLVTTARHTGQQWDAPNGWAPLQWIAVDALSRYGLRDDARSLACRWLLTVERTYDVEHRLVEKYDVETRRPGGGGEYPLQDGFGWTNGVTRALLDQYPDCK
ncbi:alpha,alpha-trehalase TreF [Solimonas terrae]|uniref:alpha,alpha-trehalase TreF n=1 Tax=Solimonas terrae TaxID=1396819 RepID=UPI0019D69497